MFVGVDDMMEVDDKRKKRFKKNVFCPNLVRWEQEEASREPMTEPSVESSSDFFQRRRDEPPSSVFKCQVVGEPSETFSSVLKKRYAIYQGR